MDDHILVRGRQSAYRVIRTDRQRTLSFFDLICHFMQAVAMGFAARALLGAGRTACDLAAECRGSA